MNGASLSPEQKTGIDFLLQRLALFPCQPTEVCLLVLAFLCAHRCDSRWGQGLKIEQTAVGEVSMQSSKVFAKCKRQTSGNRGAVSDFICYTAVLENG